jgi:uncharacterized protein YceK
MRLALAICVSLLANGCASISRPALPEQPNAPTSEGIVATVGKQWDIADQKVASSVTIIREMADKPDVVRSEATVALSFLPVPSEPELALVRQRAASGKNYAEAVTFGKKLLADIDKNWAKVEADNREALRVSQLKDARIVELTAEVERVKREASDNIWTLAGVGIAVIGAIATAFAGPKVGIPLLLSGAAIGAFPIIADSEWFSLTVITAIGLALCLGLWYLYDRIKDANDAPYEPPQK